MELFADIMKLFFEGHQPSNGLVLPGHVELELTILVSEFVDVLIHESNILCELGSSFLMLFALLPRSGNLLLEGHDVLVEQLYLLGVRLD